MANITFPCYIQKRDVIGQWRWTYYAKNGLAIAVSSEAYHNLSDCTHGLTIIRGGNSDPIYFEQ